VWIDYVSYLTFIVGNDLFPGDEWNRGPFAGCDASGHSGSINLPGSVRAGNWMLCDYAKCHRLVREALASSPSLSNRMHRVTHA
jgi:hypothetical protein